jgi:hypothetical protein
LSELVFDLTDVEDLDELLLDGNDEVSLDDEDKELLDNEDEVASCN